MEERGIKGEQANDLMRTLLPIGVPSKLRIGLDIEALIHFMHKRLCLRADEPIRRVATLMRNEVLAVEPRYSEFLVPQCQSLMYCPEKHGSCGAYPSKEDLKSWINFQIKNIKGAMSMTLECWFLVGIFIALVIVLYEESSG